MRLPQSIIQSLSVFTVHFPTTGLAILLFGMVSVNASAATQQLTCNPTGLQFGDIITGQSETLMATVTNTGQTSVTISEITVSNPEFTVSQLSLPLSLGAGQSVEVSVSFTPSANGWKQGTVKFSSNASNSTLTLEVAGSGVSSESVTAAPSSASFGQVAVGSTATLPIVLTNDRSWKVTLLAVTTTGSGFSTTGPNLPVTLAAGQSVTFNVTFKPQSPGVVGGSLLVVSPALSVPLTGTGTATGQLTIAPAPLSFGSVPVGTTQTEPMTMSAVGATVTVSSVSSSSSQFVLNGASFPLTIGAGQSMSFNVAFTPQSSGTVSGALTFGSNASNSQAVESLNGTGTVTAYSVNLFWNSSADAVGYNVYRSTTSNGTYLKINPILESNTAYSDSTVVSGQTYYYSATSVNASGQESTRSTPVQAVVP